MNLRDSHNKTANETESSDASRNPGKPVIGITASWAIRDTLCCVDIPDDYVQSVELGGGLPFIVPLRRDLSDIQSYALILDGLLMTGGVEDVHPLLTTRRSKTWHRGLKCVPGQGH